MKKLFLLLLAITTVAKAQISPKVAQSYPAHIIYKINELTSKINLTEDQQFQLGKRLAKKDSVANVVLQKGDSLSKLKFYYAINNGLLKTILSPEEFDNYLYQMNPSNQSLFALKVATTLKLTPNQIATLRKSNEEIKSKKATVENKKEKKEKKDKKANKLKKTNSIQLDSILSKPQYISMLRLFFADEAKAKAISDWKDILKAKLVITKDSSAVYSQLFKFQLDKRCLVEQVSQKYPAKKVTAIKLKYELEKKPAILMHYEIISDGKSKKNLFAEAIKNASKINLTKIQIDSLLLYYRELESIKFNNKIKKQLPTDKLTNYEYQNTAKTLDPKQLIQLFLFKNLPKANQLADKDWAILEKEELTQNQDKKLSINEFKSYHLNLLIAADKLKISKNQSNLFYKRDMMLKKPALLKLLDEKKKTEENTKTTKNALKW